MKIVLLGYMGSGKSAVGKELAEIVSVPFIDLDTYIEEKEKMPISDIFEAKGELYFRKLEKHYLEKLLKEEAGKVLSLGGGTPCYYQNMETIAEHKSKTFYLQASVGTLVRRLLSEQDKRPLIAHLNPEELPEFIGKHLFERSSFYRKAQHIITVDDVTIAEIVKKIQDKLMLI